MGACHESMQTTISHEHAGYSTAPWFTAVNIIVDCDTIGNYDDDIEYGYANGGFYTSSGFGCELGDNVMILVTMVLLDLVILLGDMASTGRYT
eukprot:6114-Heterococcus_DN1.PRE.1